MHAACQSIATQSPATVLPAATNIARTSALKAGRSVDHVTRPRRGPRADRRGRVERIRPTATIMTPG
jgi:hypothetical protein